MRKILIYTMEGKKMCFMHALMNANALINSDHEVKIIIEGASVTLIKELEEEKNKLYLALKEKNVIAGYCLACSKVLECYEDNKKSGLKELYDMTGHAGITSYVNDGYEVMVF